MRYDPFTTPGQPSESDWQALFENATGAELQVMAPELALHRPRPSLFSPDEKYLHLASLGVTVVTRNAAALERALREIKRRHLAGETPVPDRGNRHVWPHLYWVDFITLSTLLAECMPSRQYLDEDAFWWHPIGE